MGQKISERAVELEAEDLVGNEIIPLSRPSGNSSANRNPFTTPDALKAYAIEGVSVASVPLANITTAATGPLRANGTGVTTGNTTISEVTGLQPTLDAKVTTLTVGNTTTGDPGSDAELTITGNATHPVLNFAIPRGDQGEPGEGTPGADGNTWVVGDYSGGLPAATNDGDMLLDTNGYTIYQAVSGNWQEVGSIQGPEGDSGNIWQVGDANGDIPSGGTVGDLYLDTNGTDRFDVYRWNGATWDSVGSIRGADGTDGAPGDPGEAGPNEISAGSTATTNSGVFYGDGTHVQAGTVPDAYLGNTVRTNANSTITVSGGGNPLRIVRLSDSKVGVQAMGFEGWRVGTNLVVGGAANTTDDTAIRLWIRNAAGNGRYLIGENALQAASDYRVTWESGTTISGAIDTHAIRGAANVLQIGNGTTGGFGAALQQIPLSPTQLTADVANWNPGTAGNIRASANTTVNINSMVAGQNGEVRFITNVGTSTITFVHNSGNGTAANQFIGEGSANVALSGNQSCRVWYDGTSSRWRVK